MVTFCCWCWSRIHNELRTFDMRQASDRAHISNLARPHSSLEIGKRAWICDRKFVVSFEKSTRRVIYKKKKEKKITKKKKEKRKKKRKKKDIITVCADQILLKMSATRERTLWLTKGCLCHFSGHINQRTGIAYYK